MPRRAPGPAAPVPCADCSGAGETIATPTRRKTGPTRGQLGVCLACLGTGVSTPDNTTIHAVPHL